MPGTDNILKKRKDSLNAKIKTNITGILTTLTPAVVHTSSTTSIPNLKTSPLQQVNSNSNNDNVTAVLPDIQTTFAKQASNIQNKQGIDTILPPITCTIIPKIALKPSPNKTKQRTMEIEVDLDELDSSNDDFDSSDQSNAFCNSDTDEYAVNGLMELAMKTSLLNAPKLNGSGSSENVDGLQRHGNYRRASIPVPMIGADPSALYNRDGRGGFSPNRRKAHIVSEKKRRQNINEGFEDLRVNVPSCNKCNDSKAAILKKCKLFSFSLLS